MDNELNIGPGGNEEVSAEVVDGIPTAPSLVRKRRHRATRAVAPTPEPTFEDRLAQTKSAAKQLAREKKIKISLRLGVSLEVHELLVSIARKLGASGVPDVALRSMELGADLWAKQLKMRVSEGIAPLSVFERTPAASNVRTYGVDEQRVRDDLAEQAEQTQRRHDDQATALHIPGRRRAAAS